MGRALNGGGTSSARLAPYYAAARLLGAGAKAATPAAAKLARYAGEAAAGGCWDVCCPPSQCILRPNATAQCLFSSHPYPLLCPTAKVSKPSCNVWQEHPVTPSHAEQLWWCAWCLRATLLLCVVLPAAALPLEDSHRLGVVMVAVERNMAAQNYG